MRELINEIFEAILNNDVEAVKVFMQNDMKESVKAPLRHIAVMYSAVKNKTDILEYFLKNDDKISKTTVNEALVQASIVDNNEAVKIIIKNGKHVNLANILTECMTIGGSEQEDYNDVLNLGRLETMLFKTIDDKINNSTKIIRTLLKNGINTCVKNKYGVTPLKYAIDTENEGLIKDILEHYTCPRYTKKSLIGYTFRDLRIAEEDLRYLVKSGWYLKKKKDRVSIKEYIKLIRSNNNEDDLKKMVIKVLQKRKMNEIEKRLEKEEVLAVANDTILALKKKLKETDKIFNNIDRLKTRIGLNTNIKVLEVIDLCRKNNIKSLCNI